MASAKKYELSFFTATILDWKFLLTNDLYKDIIIDSLRFQVKAKRVELYAFVIMSNHLHLIWNNIHPYKAEDMQSHFLRFTAHEIVKTLRNNDPIMLEDHYVGATDRKYQIWERNPLSINIWSEEVLKQKLAYIHNNPVNAGLCLQPEEYKYSSAAVYAGVPFAWEFVSPIFML